ncbi:hypothetical protein LTR84_009207 [Exophiala bonariae]|uniref:Chromo domain-containing protein n=1 Tax=Exophiala bonariae TaxID=1690606 RepID=A0AAV9MVN7_9EURO|nr:hypothetical protein LTR84_009207 [Exophiala bonariae]
MTRRAVTSISKVGSNLDICVDSNLPQAGPDGNLPTNEELDNDVEMVAGEVARGRTTDDDAHEDSEDDGQDSEGEFGVEAILGHRFVRGTVYYETKWQGCPDKENTEELESSLMLYAPKIIQAYHTSIGGFGENTLEKKS